MNLKNGKERKVKRKIKINKNGDDDGWNTARSC
jgi:hypothetical protein